MKKIATIVGLGISGYGAALLLTKKGWKVRVTEESDTPQVKETAARLVKIANDIELETGKHTKNFIKNAGLVITSPGVRDDSRPIRWARELDIPVIDEIELGYRFCPSKIVAVTGTNGKSTTVTLISEILKAGGYDVSLCGNIGSSFCEKVLKIKKDTIVVLEVSSFQLQRVVEFRPYISLFLNITQNHFDRHKDFREYLDAKLNIFKNQKRNDWAILNQEDKNLRNLENRIKARVLYFAERPVLNGAYLENQTIYICTDGRSRGIFSSDEICLKGKHNIKNTMAAILVGEIFKIKPRVIKDVLKGFAGLEHRFEYVDEIRGVSFINDSKATTVDAAMHAIYAANKPIVLIAGGKDKGSDFSSLKDLIRQKVKSVVLIGEAREKMKKQLSGTVPIHESSNLTEAVSLSLNLAKRGDVVLLSPMCASFDMFKNFEERGKIFKKAVKSLCIAQADKIQ